MKRTINCFGIFKPALLLVVLHLHALTTQAQLWDPTFAMPTYSCMLLNPAMTAMNDSTTLTFQGNVWDPFDYPDEPSVYVGYEHASSKLHGAWGAMCNYNSWFVTRDMRLSVSYAYQMQLGKSGYLAFGASAGIRGMIHNYRNVVIYDGPNYPNTIKAEIRPRFDAGVALRLKRYWGGLSINNINTPSFTLFDYKEKPLRTASILTGFDIGKKEKLLVTPSILFQLNPPENFIGTLVFNCNAWIRNRVMLGASFFPDELLTFSTGVRIGRMQCIVAVDTEKYFAETVLRYRFK